MNALAELDSLVAALRPDILHLQESPCPPLTTRTDATDLLHLVQALPSACITAHYVILSQATQSHSSYIGTAVAKHLYPEIAKVEVFQGFAVVVQWKNGLQTANVHLAPFGQNADARFHRTGEIIRSAIAGKAVGVVLLGDTNVQRAERGTGVAEWGRVGSKGRHADYLRYL